MIRRHRTAYGRSATYLIARTSLARPRRTRPIRSLLPLSLSPRSTSSSHGSTTAGVGGAGWWRRSWGARAATRGRVPVAQAGERVHGRGPPSRARRRRLRPPRQRTHLLRPLQSKAPHARSPLPRRQGRVSTHSLACLPFARPAPPFP